MRILITGYKGFIGQNMVAALRDEYDLELYEWGDKFPSLANISQVIHLGAITSTTETDVEKVMIQNYDFTRQLFDQCSRDLVNIQFASSASVYGKNKEFKETSPVDPRTPYAWSKYLCERYLIQKQDRIKVQIFRYFNVYGPGEDHKADQASPYSKFAKQAEETGLIKIFKNSDKYLRDFVNVKEVITIHKKFLNYRDQGIWNLGTGKAKSFQQVAEEVAKKYNAKIGYISMPRNLENSYQEYTQADIYKLLKTLKQ